MKYPVYNIDGKETGSVDLPKEIFDVKFNADLVHQVAVSLSANKRQITAHAKFRSEVRGGGKKPWRQKGTGRARHGSTRSPIWKGGGVTHGPRKERIFGKEIPKKMRRKALLMALSEKARSGNLVVVDGPAFAEAMARGPKTKEMAKIISKLPCKKDSRLILLSKHDKNTYLSSRNIPKTKIQEARNLNVLKLLNNKYLLLTKDSIKTVKDTFLKESRI